MSRAWTSREKYRAGVWAVAVSAVVFVGSLTGAQLKADRQKQEVIQQFRQTTPSEQIAVLREQREALQQQKAAIENNIAQFRERVRQRESGNN